MIPFNTLSDPLSILRGPNGALSAPKTALLDPLKTPQWPERTKRGLRLFHIFIWTGSTDMILFCFLSYHFGTPRNLFLGILGLLKPPKGHFWTFSPTGRFRMGCKWARWSGRSVRLSGHPTRLCSDQNNTRPKMGPLKRGLGPKKPR